MDLSRLTDGELARQFGGDRAADAFTVLYERYVRPIHDFVARTVRDLAAAEDITQRAFIQAWEQRGALRDPDAVKPWLYRVASNLALNHVTRTRPAVDIDDVAAIIEAPGADPETAAMAAEAARLVWDAAASLEPRQRTVLELAVRQQLSSPEIAEVMQVAPAQASLLVHRAREALGNAVRYLLVARRRTHCERLAGMVPARVLQLSAEQRASVDRHMRRCEGCQGMASRLTRPEALLGSFVLLPLPRSLERPPHLRLTGARLGGGGGTPPPPPAGPVAGAATVTAARQPEERRRRRAAALLLFVLLLGAVGGLVLLRAFAGTATPVARTTPDVTAAAVASASPSPTPSPTVAPSLVPTPVASPVSTPRPTAEPAPRPPTPTPTPGFAVTSISLCFVDTSGVCNPTNATAQTCTGGAFAPNQCLYQITFVLTPGRGGTLTWSMSANPWTSCNSQLPAITPSGTVTVPSPAPAQITIKGTLTVGGNPNRSNAFHTSSASVTTPAWPSASHTTAGFYGTGCG